MKKHFRWRTKSPGRNVFILRDARDLDNNVLERGSRTRSCKRKISTYIYIPDYQPRLLNTEEEEEVAKGCLTIRQLLHRHEWVRFLTHHVYTTSAGR